ncbi:MAG: glycosyltransferase family 4 protein [Chloroflexia bacterium]|nr:glycosyltransferase family 4 protein [Chloroflexia bacterium]
MVKILILSKALVVGAYQRKLELLAGDAELALTAVVPPYWREPGVRRVQLERAFTEGYRLLVRPIALNGSFHLYFWPGLGRLLRQERPDVLHIDEESFNLATFQAMYLGQRLGARCLFFNWANLLKRLPPPFSWFERYTLDHAAYAVAGNQEAAAILQAKGYRGPLRTIPQFGVDTGLFRPRPDEPTPAALHKAPGELLLGYVGRLVPAKGVQDLLSALAGLPPSIRLLVVGGGPQQEQLLRQRDALGLRERVRFAGWRPSTELPQLYPHLDALVLPSRTWPNWKEQFGRVLVEAMACAVPVVGSDSGEIPHVIGEAGLVFAEGQVDALQRCLRRLQQEPDLRQELGRRGRQRVLAHYSQERIAAAYRQVYLEMMA